MFQQVSARLKAGLYDTKKFPATNHLSEKDEKIADWPKARDEAHALAKASGARIQRAEAYGSDTSGFNGAMDIIVLHSDAKKSAGRFIRTLFHELGHWTGSPKRLARDTLIESWSSLTLGQGEETTGYMREELVAELTSAFVCSHLGVDCAPYHVLYLRHYLAKLVHEPLDNQERVYDEFDQAAARAERAAKYLLSFSVDKSQKAA